MTDPPLCPIHGTPKSFHFRAETGARYWRCKACKNEQERLRRELATAERPLKSGNRIREMPTPTELFEQAILVRAEALLLWSEIKLYDEQEAARRRWAQEAQEERARVRQERMGA